MKNASACARDTHVALMQSTHVHMMWSGQGWQLPQRPSVGTLRSFRPFFCTLSESLPTPTNGAVTPVVVVGSAANSESEKRPQDERKNLWKKMAELFEGKLRELVRSFKHLYNVTSSSHSKLLQSSWEETGQWRRTISV